VVQSADDPLPAVDPVAAVDPGTDDPLGPENPDEREGPDDPQAARSRAAAARIAPPDRMLRVRRLPGSLMDAERSGAATANRDRLAGARHR
jgi:hypothetical protein